MNRRTAIKGIFAIAGLSYVSIIGIKYFKGNLNQTRGKLEAHSLLIAELTDVIIPPTTTPGAKEALVHNYIISYMEDCSSMKEYNNFLDGLNDLQENCKNTYNHNFENCTVVQKNKIIENLDNNQDSTSLFSKISNKIQGRSFFDILKTLTIEGYCTSELGATKFLEYQPIPGKYIAITNLKVNQKAWATK
ncbi:gluconate 2-dehydrogenase subunit 3 family protein [Flavobacterium sp.]|uniref:gluconate 2-dehydrogenase subunit 3 family protein n=1 Tax=Flavobacterium sp. TaxID=239 RepID=UPI0037A10D15